MPVDKQTGLHYPEVTIKKNYLAARDLVKKYVNDNEHLKSIFKVYEYEIIDLMHQYHNQKTK